MARKILAVTISVAMMHCAAPAFAGDTASVRQAGINGTATIDQQGNVGAAFAAVDQRDGFGNDAAITQFGLVLAPGVRLGTAVVSQAGERNYATVEQGGLGVMDATVSQDGDLNRAGISQADTEASVRSAQSGFHNVADISQTRAFGAEVLLRQDGSDNSAAIVQHDGVFLHVDLSMTGNGNVAYIDQSGFRAQVSAEQDGGNELTVIQAALGPDPVSVSISQTGVANAATVTQAGDGASATIVQPGVANAATIIQRF